MNSDSAKFSRFPALDAIKPAAFDLLALFGLFVAGVAIVNPFGDFPLNDDWSYGFTVKRLLETGGFFPGGWGAMTLLTNVLWGAMFCLPDGFSFDALRLSTLTIAFLGVCATYFLVLEVRQPRWIAVISALTLAFNPIYFALSHTFMTDVLFTTLSTLSVFFFARHLRRDSSQDLAIGTLLALAATLSRQLALFSPLAFALTLLLKRGVSARSVFIAMAPLAICFAVLTGFQHWLDVNGRLPALYKAHNAQLLGALDDVKGLSTKAFRNGFHVIAYLGLFLLPVLVLAIKGILATGRKRAALLLGGFFLLMTIGDAIARRHGQWVMPLMGNVLTRAGIGPLTLPDTLPPVLHYLPVLPLKFWWAVTAVAFAGGAILLASLTVCSADITPSLLHRERLSDQATANVFLILCTTIYLLPVIVTGMFDRYMLPVIPLLLAGILGIARESVARTPASLATSVRVPVLLVTAFGCFAVCTTRDYLAWNRVRWEALRHLVNEEHVPPSTIDGGFEFNALYFYDPATPLAFGKDSRGKSWWWVHDDTYQIAFGSVPGYRVVREYAYRHWLPWHVQKVVVLRRD